MATIDKTTATRKLLKDLTREIRADSIVVDRYLAEMFQVDGLAYEYEIDDVTVETVLNVKAVLSFHPLAVKERASLKDAVRAEMILSNPEAVAGLVVYSVAEYLRKVHAIRVSEVIRGEIADFYDNPNDNNRAKESGQPCIRANIIYKLPTLRPK